MTETYYSTDVNILYNFINGYVKEGWNVKKMWTETKWKMFRYITVHYVTFIKVEPLLPKQTLEFDWGPISEKELTVPLTKDEREGRY